MPATLTRIFFLCNILNAILLYLVPKKLRAYLPDSWSRPQHQQQPFNLPPPCPSPVAAAKKRPVRARKTDAAELGRVFEMFDRNGDGRITRMELRESLEGMGIFIPEADLGQMIERIDADGDGCVDIGEFGGLYGAMMEEEREEEEEDNMREAFEVFDRDGDGFITVEELKAVLASLGLKQGRTDEDCRTMIDKVDVDGDGRVDFVEFKQMMRGVGFAASS